MNKLFMIVCFLTLAGTHQNNLHGMQAISGRQTDRCTICWSDMETNLNTLSCSHTFHNDCFIPWVKEHPFCPICKIDVPHNQLQTLERPATDPVNPYNYMLYQMLSSLLPIDHFPTHTHFVSRR